MMHYDIKDENSFAISETYFDEKLPYFGLIEECFVGFHYAELMNAVDSLSKEIEDLLCRQFNIEKIRIKRL